MHKIIFPLPAWSGPHAPAGKPRLAPRLRWRSACHSPSEPVPPWPGTSTRLPSPPAAGGATHAARVLRNHGEPAPTGGSKTSTQFPSLPTAGDATHTTRVFRNHGETGSDRWIEAERQRSLRGTGGLPAGACGPHHAGSGKIGCGIDFGPGQAPVPADGLNRRVSGIGVWGRPQASSSARGSMRAAPRRKREKEFMQLKAAYRGFRRRGPDLPRSTRTPCPRFREIAAEASSP